MVPYADNYFKAFQKAVANSEASDASGKKVEMDAAFRELCDWSRRAQIEKKVIHFVGNGASACMASHMAVDWTKNAAVRALAYNDVAFLTAIGNDIGFDQIFSKPIEWYASAGDILATVSSSGRSKNVLAAIEAARKIGLKVVTFSGMKRDNPSRGAGDINIYVPAWTYGVVETAHQLLLHAWLDCFMEVREWELNGPQVVRRPQV